MIRLDVDKLLIVILMFSSIGLGLVSEVFFFFTLGILIYRNRKNIFHDKSNRGLILVIILCSVAVLPEKSS